jgi:DNA invertase Pin-like site-specific DNA recombinase
MTGLDPELILTILPSVTQFERQRIGERIADSKAQLIRDGRQGGAA